VVLALVPRLRELANILGAAVMGASSTDSGIAR
jgi:hypothetical protein